MDSRYKKQCHNKRSNALEDISWIRPLTYVVRYVPLAFTHQAHSSVTNIMPQEASVFNILLLFMGCPSIADRDQSNTLDRRTRNINSSPLAVSRSCNALWNIMRRNDAVVESAWAARREFTNPRCSTLTSLSPYGEVILESTGHGSRLLDPSSSRSFGNVRTVGLLVKFGTVSIVGFRYYRLLPGCENVWTILRSMYDHEHWIAPCEPVCRHTKEVSIETCKEHIEKRVKRHARGNRCTARERTRHITLPIVTSTLY